MNQKQCRKCGLDTINILEIFAYDRYYICKECEIHFFENVEKFFQPERSKREDLEFCSDCENIKVDMEHYLPTKYHEYLVYSKMRCSEHCGNTVRDK